MNKVDREHIFELFALYEPILTKAQAQAILDHYAYDLSFGEISKEQSISRAAANEIVKSAISKMEEYESKLHLLSNKEKLLEIASSSKEEIKEKLDYYLKDTYGI